MAKALLSDSEINEQVARGLGYTKHWQSAIDNESDGYDYWTDGKHQNKNELDFTTSIAAAWEIVEYCQSNLRLYRIGLHNLHASLHNDPRLWEFQVHYLPPGSQADPLWGNGRIMFSGEAPTAPMAICLAYLKLRKGL